MALQQISFNFFDDEPLPPKSEVKKAASKKASATAPIVDNSFVVQEPEPIVAEPFEDIVVETTPRAVAFDTPLATKKTPSNKPKSTRGRKSIKANEATVDLVEIPDDEELFKKSYYSIGIVADMFKVNVSLLRYWENEFNVLKPKKNGKGNRLFRPEDIKNLQLIHHLIRERKYTIEGAKDFIKKGKKINESFELIQSLKRVKGFLLELKANI